jgi:membrane fusion protein (multidrug efflux system)
MKIAAFSPLNAALLTLCITCLVACGQAPGGPPPTFTGTPKVSVLTLASKPQPLITELPGRVTSMVGAEVRPQVTGIIQERLFVEGDTVKAGQLLYQIDPATYQAAADSAKAALTKADASLVLAQLKAKRNRELVEIKAVSRQAADESDAALKQAEADVASARAALQTQLINLQYTQIKAPVSGRIGRSSVTAGALVTANQAIALARVQQLDPIYIDVTQASLALLELKRSRVAGSLKEGSAPVSILLQNGMSYSERGVLQFSEAIVEEDTDTVTLRIKVPNPNGDLLPGMYARALLEVGVVEKAILIPQKALMRDAQGQSYVAIVDAAGVMRHRPVKVSRAIGDQWLVDEGLAAGERVVIEGQQKVQPGNKVEILAVDASNNTNSIVQH